MKRSTADTRCEKCTLILTTRYEENGVTTTEFHPLALIALVDRSQNRFAISCPTCGHETEGFVTAVPA